VAWPERPVRGREPEIPDPADPPGRQRIDKWLWHARVVRTRSAAAALVAAGHVRIDGERVRAPGHAVRPGQVVTVALDRHVRLLRVIAFAARRGDAAAAAALYEAVGRDT